MKMDNYKNTLNQAADLLLMNHPDLVLPKAMAYYRQMLSKRVAEHFNHIVAYGPFKGLKLTEDTWWGSSDKASMILGVYEQEVLKLLSEKPSRYTNFIDLGAADGYYAAGTLFKGIFQTSYCFESSEKGRSVIEENARKHGLSDKIIIHGTADKNFYSLIPQDIIDRSVMLVDIEGGEFDLFDVGLFEKFRKSLIVIELHDWFYSDGEAKLNNLIAAAEKYFYVDYLTMGSRDMSLFPELAGLPDTDRWLICSEGRGRLMKWLKLMPKIYPNRES